MALHPITAAHVALMSAVIAGNPEDWWRRKLGLILDGAAAMLARRGHPDEAGQDVICR